MDSGEKKLTKILGKRDLQKCPAEVVKKLEKYFDHEPTASGSSSKADTGKSNQDKHHAADHDKLVVQNLEYEAKMSASEQSVGELRAQLDVSRGDIGRLSEKLKQYESEILTYRRERNEAFDERDKLVSQVEEKTIQIDRFQLDMDQVQGQLAALDKARCDAIISYDEIKSREEDLTRREQTMEQERILLDDKIANLQLSLANANTELRTIRQDCSLKQQTLETDLEQARKDLLVAGQQVSHLTTDNQLLNRQTEELRLKVKQQQNELNEIIRNCHREIEATSKLNNLYKREVDQKVEDLKRVQDELSKGIAERETIAAKVKQLEEQLKSVDQAAEVQKLKDQIETLTEQLRKANEEGVAHSLETLFPTAAASSERLSSSMSLTEIYSLYTKTTAQLNDLRLEVQLKTVQLDHLRREKEEQIPFYESQMEKLSTLEQQNREKNNELEQLKTSLAAKSAAHQDFVVKFEDVESENKKIKLVNYDLSLQVAHLMDVNQGLRTNSEASSDVQKKLVTFSEITELQENNNKLLALVHDMSNKLQEFEAAQTKLIEDSYQRGLEFGALRLKHMEDEHLHQSRMMALCEQRKERFKKLYYDSINSDSNKDDIEDDEAAMDCSEVLPEVAATATTPSILTDSKLKEMNRQMKELKKEYDDYRKDKLENEKIFQEQFDAMRDEVRELTASNCKLYSSSQRHEEQLELQQQNVNVYRKQIEILEERNRNYDTTISKQEQSIVYLRDEALGANNKLAAAQLQCDRLQFQYRNLVESEAALQKELSILHRERLGQHLLQNNLEMIRAMSDTTENEQLIQLQKRLATSEKQCIALERKLFEEQNRLDNITKDFKRKSDTAAKKLADELAQTDELRGQLNGLREDIANKTQQIDELSRKLQESLTPCKSDNPIAKANKKVKDLQMQLDHRTADYEKLKKEFHVSAEEVKKSTKTAKNLEKQLTQLQEAHAELSEKYRQELAATQLIETNLRSRVETLETEYRLKQAENATAASPSFGTLNKVQAELKATLKQLADNKRELGQLRTECHTQKVALQSIEEKYANEMSAHSMDIQSLSAVKFELNKLIAKIKEISDERDDAVSMLQANRELCKAESEQNRQEKEAFEGRVQDLHQQNSLLLQQIEESTSVPADHEDKERLMEEINSINCAQEADASHRLLQVVRFMYKENELSASKVDVLRTLNERLKVEVDILQKRLADADAVTVAPAAAVGGATIVLSTEQYEELNRKIRNLDAITDSNRYLREERDALSARMKEFTDAAAKVEAELVPLQEQHRLLQTKHDEQVAENLTLRTNVERTRKRANELIERSARNPPEDFKRLQNERESLAKMLTAEKDAAAKVTFELTALRQEKQRSQQELLTTTKQMQASLEENKKMKNDLNVLQQQQKKMAAELMQQKNAALQSEQKVRETADELTAKEASINDAKSMLAKLRNLARSYKTKCVELEAKVAAAPPPSEPAAEGSRDASSTELQLLRNTISELQRENELLQNNVLDEANDSKQNQHETRIAQLERDLQAQDAANKETVARLTQDNKSLLLRVNQLNRQLGSVGGQSSTADKAIADLARTANVKPMAGPSTAGSSGTTTPTNPQTQSIQLRRSNETPLASIRPMSVQSGRTAAILPQNATPQQGSSSDQSSSTDTISSSASSSHTDYMPATSSAIVQTVQPMAPTTSSAESSHEAESVSNAASDAATIQAVAHVTPRIETAAAGQQSTDSNNQPTASTSGVGSHNQASSSNAVTTSQKSGSKRPREAEGTIADESTTTTSDTTSPQTKRTRQIDHSTFQGISESGVDVEYQVPTSSQRDQEDYNAMGDSDDDDEAIALPDEGTSAEADGGTFADDADEMEESYEQDGQDQDVQVGQGSNEVDIDDNNSEPSAATSSNAPDVGTSVETLVTVAENQQIQAISSGSEATAGPSSTPSSIGRRQPISRQQQNLILQQQGYDELGTDDSIVPSTPTLYVPRRADGFSEAIHSPQVPHTGRFTFTNDSNSSSSHQVPTGSGTLENIDDTRMDLSQLSDPAADAGALQQSDPEHVAPQPDEQSGVPVVEPVASVQLATENEALNEGASTSKAADAKAADVVVTSDSSAGEAGVVPPVQAQTQFDEGREAEATSYHTRSRTVPTTRGSRRGRGGHHNINTDRPVPIQYHVGGGRGGGGNQYQQNIAGGSLTPQQQMQLQQQQQQQQQHVRGSFPRGGRRRVKRSFPNNRY